MKYLLLFLLTTTFLFGDKMITIATYNVENLFDVSKSKNRYSEYKQGSKLNWNHKNYKIKLQNIARVIKGINADIISLQEIGSLQALKDLKYVLKEFGLYYQYYKIADRKGTTVKVAILSKIPFVYNKELSINSSMRYRNILETKFTINGKDLYIFTNHWKAKSGSESMRITCAMELRYRISEIGYDKNIILVGDFNSDYEEYIKFKRKRRLNDTNGKTGINHILRTLKQTKKVKYVKYEKNNFYNLWYDANEEDRYSYIYRGKKEALDNILVSQSLIQNSGIYYKSSSIHSYKRDFLFKKNKIYRWQTTKSKPRRHKGKGYSDHLAVVGKFIVKS